ncbi:MAG: GH116 family glycosyl hydrolase [Ignavibacteriales bacterium]|nr:GH116 family glycosyl hydrolase [Ignavibacteriales bacterium]
MKKLFLLISLTFIFWGCGSSDKKTLLEQLAIEVKDTTRAFSYTNKKFGFYFGETNSYFKDSWQGWTLKEQRIFNDYQIFANGNLLERNKSTATVYPHILKRDYNNLLEELFFADSLDLIILKLKNINSEGIEIKFLGLNSDGKVAIRDNVASFNLNNILPGNHLFIAADSKLNTSSDKLAFETTGKDSLTILIYISSSSVEVQNLLQQKDRIISNKETRIEKLLNASYIKTNDEKFNKALMWAKVSLDALITTQDYKGIWAGLPWFNNNWGRDTFISLPGATLVTGNYQDAKEILLAFAKFQDNNPASKYYGRIPNRITLKESIYNTVDGTPWFIIQCYNYFYYTNDLEFIKEVYPVVKIAVEAALKRSTDNNGFLMHADAETWMDAVGPNGPWSPRGNRAVDVQALWYKQLLCSYEIGRILKDTTFANTSMVAAYRLRTNFQKFFVDTTKNIIYDRLKEDGTKDHSERPNQFFALNEPDLFTTSLQRLKILGNAMQVVVFPYGVTSLSQNDENFHPYHDYKPYYVKDAAYHNGIIWQWNSGSVVQTLCGFGKQDTAWKLTSELTHQILDRGAVGTLAELMEAFPRQGEKEPRLSGTFSQAWSLAEYIRNIYQDYLGVKPDAYHKALYLLPTLPNDLTDIEFDQRVGNDKVKIKYNFTNELNRITVNAVSVKDSLDIAAAILNKADASFQMKTSLKKNDNLVIEVPTHSNTLSDLKVFRNQQRISISCQIYNEPPANFALYQNVKFAVPFLNRNLKALKGPEYKLLTNNEIKIEDENSTTIFNLSDPEKDEEYKYPLNPNFAAGILDIIHFSLKEDSDNYFFALKFRKLANPGWHNEYGFQLTYASICLNTNSNEKNTTDVKLNSGYKLPILRSFDRQINVGGGIEIKDGSGKIIAAYLPDAEDIKNPLGNVKSNIINFSIPKKMIGTINGKSVISILVGAQDDHGGAGAGEFRTVDQKATEWTGGGKKKKSDHNIYDFLLIN